MSELELQTRWDRLSPEEKALRSLMYGLWRGERRPERSTGAWQETNRRLHVVPIHGQHGCLAGHVILIAGSPPHGILFARYGDINGSALYSVGSICNSFRPRVIQKSSGESDVAPGSPMDAVRNYVRRKGDDGDILVGTLNRIAALAASEEQRAKDKIFALADTALNAVKFSHVDLM